MLTMAPMQTRTDMLAPANWLDPFGSWEAAVRWNAVATEWMTKGWQQWLELVTVWPALEPARAQAAVVAAPAGTQQARNVRAVQEQAAEAHPAAKDAPRRAARTQSRAAGKPATKRSASQRAARPQAAARSGRSRG